MLKNKSKEELLEMLYKLEGERSGLIDCYKKQSKVLQEVAEVAKSKRNWISIIINFFVLPFKIAAVLRNNNEYFFTLKIERMKFTEDEIFEAYEAINLFENKQTAPKPYKEYVKAMLGLKHAICDTCGDIMQRLHDDFQKRINAEAKNLGEHLLKPIKFESGKYHEGGFYEKRVPILCYSDLRKLCKLMKGDIKKYNSKASLKAQAKLIEKDLKTLQTYIVEKLNGIEDDLEEIDLDISKSNEVENVANEIKVDKGDGVVKSESTKELKSDEGEEIAIASSDETVINKKSVATAELPEVEEKKAELTDEKEVKNEYKNEDAKEMKVQGMTFKEIGLVYGVSDSTIRSRLKKYNLSLEEAEK